VQRLTRELSAVPGIEARPAETAHDLAATAMEKLRATVDPALDPRCCQGGSRVLRLRVARRHQGETQEITCSPIASASRR
ncbi:MAG TPA: hypothetical protein VII40_02535, partial [Xanthobacteraceae bacterium]